MTRSTTSTGRSEGRRRRGSPDAPLNASGFTPAPRLACPVALRLVCIALPCAWLSAVAAIVLRALA